MCFFFQILLASSKYSTVLFTKITVACTLADNIQKPIHTLNIIAHKKIKPKKEHSVTQPKKRSRSIKLCRIIDSLRIDLKNIDAAPTTCILQVTGPVSRYIDTSARYFGLLPTITRRIDSGKSILISVDIGKWVWRARYSSGAFCPYR